MLWKFNTLTEQFSLWSTLRPRNLAVESLICHYPGFCQECGTWPVWRERFLSVTNKESSEQQIPHVAQQLSQTAEMPEFSCKRCWGTFNDHSCEGLGLLFCFTESMAPSEQCVVCVPPMSRWGPGAEEGWDVFYHWHCFQRHLHTLHSLLSPRSELHLLSSNVVQCLEEVHQFREGSGWSFLNVCMRNN